MTQAHSAQIIAFPAIARPAPDPRARLQAALAALGAALDAQRIAVAEWRGAMGSLQSSVASLGSSLHVYRDTLGMLGSRVAGLHEEATCLAERADRMRRAD